MFIQSTLSLLTVVPQCPALPLIADGSITYTGDSTLTADYDVGTMATFSCDSGHYRTSTSSRFCVEETGTAFWNGTSPICVCELPLSTCLHAYVLESDSDPKLRNFITM